MASSLVTSYQRTTSPWTKQNSCSYLTCRTLPMKRNYKDSQGTWGTIDISCSSSKLDPSTHYERCTYVTRSIPITHMTTNMSRFELLTLCIIIQCYMLTNISNIQSVMLSISQQINQQIIYSKFQEFLEASRKIQKLLHENGSMHRTTCRAHKHV